MKDSIEIYAPIRKWEDLRYCFFSKFTKFSISLLDIFNASALLEAGAVIKFPSP